VALEIDTGLSVRGDAMRIRQIVRNLIRNALRYGGPTVRLRTESVDGRVRIQVRDDGPGVPPDIFDHLFESFTHGENAGSLGLGLSVSRALARQMAGELRYFRDEQWTVFELELAAG
jgi:signal transduction histidine kinase